MRRTLVASMAIAVVFMLNASVASAHSVSYPTAITAHGTPDGVVQAGDDVTIHGKVRSDVTACFESVRVKLIQVGVGKVDQTDTNLNGRYHFKVAPEETTAYRVKYPGKILNAVHPHTHVCEASAARIRVTVG